MRERGDTVRKGLLNGAADMDSQEEEDLAPAVMEETTSGGSVDRIGPDVIKPSEYVLVNGDRANVLSQGGPEAGERSKPGREHEPKKKRLMKRGSRRASIEIHEVATGIDPATRYSEISTNLRDVKLALRQMSREQNKVQKASDIATSKRRYPQDPESFMGGKADRKGSEIPCIKAALKSGNSLPCCYQKDISPVKLAGSP